MKVFYSPSQLCSLFMGTRGLPLLIILGYWYKSLCPLPTAYGFLSECHGKIPGYETSLTFVFEWTGNVICIGVVGDSILSLTFCPEIPLNCAEMWGRFCFHAAFNEEFILWPLNRLPDLERNMKLMSNSSASVPIWTYSIKIQWLKPAGDCP